MLLLAEAADATTVAGDKGFDVASFVAGVRALGVTPHVAQKVVGSAIDDRTTRHPGYAISQQKRKLIEQVFGWLKTVGGLRKLRHRGGELVDSIVTLAAATYNLVRCARCSAGPRERGRSLRRSGSHRDEHREMDMLSRVTFSSSC